MRAWFHLDLCAERVPLRSVRALVDDNQRPVRDRHGYATFHPHAIWTRFLAGAWNVLRRRRRGWMSG